MALSRQASDLSVQILIGEAYKAQKLSLGGDRRSDNFSSAQNEPLKNKMRTSQKIAEQFGVGKETVKRAEHFLDGLNAAENRKRPGIAPRPFDYFVLSRSIVSSMARLMNSVVLLPSFFA